MDNDKKSKIEEAHKQFVESVFGLAAAISDQVETKVKEVSEAVTEKINELTKKVKGDKK